MKRGYVYIAGRFGTGVCKIGMSEDVGRRLKDLQVSSPTLRIRHTIKSANARWLERYLHDAFRDKHVSGEWFKIDADDLAFLRLIRECNCEAEIPSGLAELHRDHRNDPVRGNRVGRPRTRPNGSGVRVPLSTAERDAAKACAAREGLSASVWMREAIVRSIRS